MSKKTLSDFPISKRWKPVTPDLLQLYAFPTPNGVKVSIALEELGVPYEAHLVMLNETETPAFLSLNPNNKIPAIIDPDGPNGEAMGLWESGAILIYLAEKYGGLLPEDAALKYETIQWVMFQMGGASARCLVNMDISQNSLAKISKTRALANVIELKANGC